MYEGIEVPNLEVMSIAESQLEREFGLVSLVENGEEGRSTIGSEDTLIV